MKQHDNSSLSHVEQMAGLFSVATEPDRPRLEESRHRRAQGRGTNMKIKDESDFPVPITVSYETIDEVSDEGKGDYQELDPGHSINNIEPG